MRYKQHTVQKIEAQAQKLRTLQRAIQSKQMSGTQAIEFLDKIVKELEAVVERLELEPNE